MVALRADDRTTALPTPTIGVGERALLNHLRFVAMGCRSKPRTDLFEACALLQVGRSDSLAAYGEALMRCLNQALGKASRLLAPGTEELTFDECWLVQLARAEASGDRASAAFLLNSRVGREHRRLVGFLMTRISECFELH
ncbi:MAG: hypothetical protein AAF281_05345 [Pseudomonadota bacterium]